MKTNALARLLPNFQVTGTQRAQPLGSRASNSGAAERDPAQAVAEAEERGFRRGFDAAQAECDSRRAEDAAEFQARLAEDRLRWTTEHADRLAEQIPAAFAALEASLAETAARLLLPFLGAAVREKALDSLRDAIAGLRSDGDRPLMRIAGPEDLLQSLRRRLGSDADSIEFLADGEAEVRVIADDTILETRLEAWSNRLTEAAG